MPHSRLRHCVPLLKKLAAFWPAVGVVGPRQCGKTTALRDQLQIQKAVTLDDEDALDSALHSAKVFLSRLTDGGQPILIDEIQKAPALFDAIKVQIDKKRIPGRYFLTGSTQFSTRVGVRESLTGRIGLLRLFPLTNAEAHRLPLLPPKVLQIRKARISVEQWTRSIFKGGMPVPLFSRDAHAQNLYWTSWLETTIHRDLARLFKSKYDPRIVLKILSKMKERALLGGYFELTDLDRMQARTALKYLTAMEEIFLINRLPCHELGVGKDRWMIFDSGLLNHLMKNSMTEGATLSLARTALQQELMANLEYCGERLLPEYYKSKGGSPVDLVWDGVPIKIITSSKLSSIGWEERALEGAMKTLKAPIGLLYAPVAQSSIPKKSGIGIIPWGYWS